MLNTRRGFTLFLIFAFVTQSFASQKIDELVRAEMQENGIPGLAIAVVVDGEPEMLEVYGVANVELDVPVTVDSVFELASVTKQFTAAAVMLLVSEGKLSLDESIVAFVDDAPPEWRDIHIRHLLSHTAGLADRFEETVDGRSIMDHSSDQMIRSAIQTQMVGGPGEQWSYSDQGYVLLGWAVEQVSDRSYEGFIRDRLLAPSGMGGSHLHNKYSIIPGRVAGYEMHEGRLRNVRRDWQFGIVSHFGLMASISQLAAWEKSLVDRSVLSGEQLETMWTPHWQLSRGEGFSMNYGFGWFVAKLGDRTVVEHTGVTGTSYLRVLDTNTAVILLSNLAHYDVARLGRRIAKLLDPSIPFPDAAL